MGLERDATGAGRRTPRGGGPARGKTLAVAFAAVALLAIPARAGTAPIEGPSWRLTSLDGRDFDATVPVATVRFAGGRIEAFTGCNRASGSYTIEGGQVRTGPLAGTMMACDDAVMVIENAVKAALSGVLRFEVVEDRLTLTAESGTVLVFGVEAPPNLEGVAWEVTGFNNGREAVVSPLPGTALTLRFAEGAVVGHAGCNEYRAQYTRKDDRIEIGSAAAARKHCPGEGVMAQEREFLAALESATSWTLDRGNLDMHRADGARALTAKPGGGS